MIKKAAYIKVVVCSICLSIISNLLVGQNNITSKIRVLRGSNLSFNFNSYNRYQSGIVYQNFTQLQLYFNDTISGGAPNPSSLGWQLTARAIQSNISGDLTIFNLPLNTILISIRIDGTEYGPFPLEASDLVLTQGAEATLNKNVEITYLCGTLPTNSLINKVPDNYVVDVEFTLKPQ